MSAIDVLDKLVSTELFKCDYLRYCLVDTKKCPYTIKGELCRPNCDDDFVNFVKLFDVVNLDNYAGIGISIKASNISAIDVDKCFSTPFDFNSIDERGLNIFNMFKNLAYIEFSFSGKGMRILFKQADIPDYTKKYYVKNSNNNIEFYQPSGAARYVTVTGCTLSNKPIDSEIEFSHVIIAFLDKYMLRPVKVPRTENLPPRIETRSYETLRNIFKYHCFKNIPFQNLVFSTPSGSNGNESETDYAIISYIYENITTDKDMINKLFMDTYFYQHKDAKHVKKWLASDYRYLNYIYDHL